MYTLTELGSSSSLSEQLPFETSSSVGDCSARCCQRASWFASLRKQWPCQNVYMHEHILRDYQLTPYAVSPPSEASPAPNPSSASACRSAVQFVVSGGHVGASCFATHSKGWYRAYVW